MHLYNYIIINLNEFLKTGEIQSAYPKVNSKCLKMRNLAANHQNNLK